MKTRLNDIADLLEHGFSQDSYARTKAGEPVWIGSPEATCFCFYGAQYKLGLGSGLHDERSAEARAMLKYLKSTGYEDGIGQYNDENRQKTVVAACRAAAKMAEKVVK